MPIDETIIGHDQEEEPFDNEVPNMTTRSGRTIKLTPRMQESMEQRQQGVVTYKTEITEEEAYYDAFHEDDYLLQDAMDHPIAFMTHTDGDTMYFDEAMRAPDRSEFVKACIKEMNDHIERKHWELVPRNKVPKGVKILPAVWSMKRKRDIKTRKVYKWKARLNVHGGRQEYAVNYFETYAPVVTWYTVRLLLILSILLKWHTRQIDFILAYPQADIEYDMYMELPKGIETKHGNGKTHVLKLLKNLYGQKQAGRVWNQHLHTRLIELGFKQSTIDECLYFRGTLLFVVYVDDGILASKSQEEIEKAIKDIRNAGCDVDDQGNIKDYLGVNVEKLPDGRIKLSQPHLIDQIIEMVNLPVKATGKTVPAPSSKILHRYANEPPFENHFHYRGVVGKLNFLEKSTRPDISYATHQIARFSQDPKRSHGEAVIWLCKYLRETRKDGLILDPRIDKSLEVYADADFAGNWNKATAASDASTAKSRSGFVITFAGCPILWSSKLQTQIALSTTEAEYISLSESLRSAIPLMHILDEIKSQGHNIVSQTPSVHCKAFEDNSGALELARVPKLRPRTKHINLIYHHFKDYVRKGHISIYPIATNDQVADIFTKPLPQNSFLKHRKTLLKW